MDETPPISESGHAHPGSEPRCTRSGLYHFPVPTHYRWGLVEGALGSERVPGVEVVSYFPLLRQILLAASLFR